MPDEVENDRSQQDVVVATVQPASGGQSWSKQAIGLSLGGLFLWLAFRDANPAELWARTQNLNLIWLVAIAVVSIFSHWLRAVRWVILMRPLSEKKISTWNSFCAIVIGYAVNIVIPRGGEVARVISISKSENIPWAGVVPTMFIDRLLDVAMLVLLIGITLVMLPADIKTQIGWLVPSGLVMCVLTVVGLFVLPKLGLMIKWLVEYPAVKQRLPANILDLALNMSVQFDRGTRSLSDPIGFPAIGFLSVAMWFCYWLNLYLAVLAFNLQDKIDISRSLMIFAIGSVGVIVPTPGSVGTYHYAVSQAMTMIAGIDPATALAFVTVLHALSFVLVTAVAGAVCFAIQSLSAKKTT